MKVLPFVFCLLVFFGLACPVPICVGQDAEATSAKDPADSPAKANSSDEEPYTVVLVDRYPFRDEPGFRGLELAEEFTAALTVKPMESGGSYEVKTEIVSPLPFDVEFDNVAASCTCSDIKVSKGVFRKGEKTALEFQVRVDGRQKQPEVWTTFTFSKKGKTVGRFSVRVPIAGWCRFEKGSVRYEVEPDAEHPVFYGEFPFQFTEPLDVSKLTVECKGALELAEFVIEEFSPNQMSHSSANEVSPDADRATPIEMKFGKVKIMLPLIDLPEGGLLGDVFLYQEAEGEKKGNPLTGCQVFLVRPSPYELSTSWLSFRKHREEGRFVSSCLGDSKGETEVRVIKCFGRYPNDPYPLDVELKMIRNGVFRVNFSIPGHKVEASGLPPEVDLLLEIGGVEFRVLLEVKK